MKVQLFPLVPALSFFLGTFLALLWWFPGTHSAEAVDPSQLICVGSGCYDVYRYYDGRYVCSFKYNCPDPCSAPDTQPCVPWQCGQIGVNYYTQERVTCFAPTPTATPTPTPTPTPLPPTLTLTFLCDTWGDNGWCRTNGRIHALGIDPNNQSIQITGTTGGPSPVSLSCTGTSTCTAKAAVVEGTGIAQATATGTGGAVTQQTPWKYDPTPPDLTISFPGTFSCVVLLKGKSKDDTSGLAQLRWSKDGGKTWMPISADANGNFEVSWDVRTLPEGPRTLIFQAKDEAGNLREQRFTVPIQHPHFGLGHRGRWFFWEEIQLHADAGCNPIRKMRIVIEDIYSPRIRVWEWDTLGWEVYRVSIRWDARWEDGTWARPGMYPVRLEAEDSAGRLWREEGRIIIPRPTPLATPTWTPTVTATPWVSPTPTLTPTPAKQALTLPQPSLTSPTPPPIQNIAPKSTPTPGGSATHQTPAGPSLGLLAAWLGAMALLGFRDPRVPELAQWRRLIVQTKRLYTSTVLMEKEVHK